MSEMAEINLNGTVRVTLRKPGERVWQDFYADLGLTAPLWHAGETRELQVWELAQVFGPHMHMGGDPPVETGMTYRHPF